jgi:glycosyltransferase involved in cell wall biosynthesis
MTGIDTTRFREESQRCRPKRIDERNRLGLRGTVFVFSGGFSPRKGIDPYLKALTKLRLIRPKAEISLLFIGEGELRANIEDWANAHPDVPVVLTGFVQITELPRLYTCGDWFVLPTLEDCWPLATLEPLVCGLPQVFSIYNGATNDLVAWPGTGLISDPLDEVVLSETLASALDSGAYVLPNHIIEEVSAFYGPKAQAQRAFGSLKKLTILNADKTSALASR